MNDIPNYNGVPGYKDAFCRRATELRLLEHLTALLLWCDRLESHPGYRELSRRHTGLVGYLKRSTTFALARRAALFSNSLAEHNLEADISRLQTILGSLKGLEQGLTKRAQQERLASVHHPHYSLN